MSTFMLVLQDDPKAFASDISPAEIQAIVAQYKAWGERLAAQGRMRGGEKLKDEGGRQLSKSRGQVRVVDGPFAEAKEVFGGYFLISADSYEQAVELCRDHPHLDYGLRIDIRQVDEV
ncbi:MAG: transcription initiation protein [Planctomycetes bacterium]|nr:transcription initiation protein [Planctomycetota bacterium]